MPLAFQILSRRCGLRSRHFVIDQRHKHCVTVGRHRRVTHAEHVCERASGIRLPETAEIGSKAHNIAALVASGEIGPPTG
jgi:hypothetical protein